MAGVGWVPCRRLAGPSEQPIVAAGRVVTFWAQVSECQSYGTLAELGSLLRRLRKLDPPVSPLVLPELRPFAGAESRIRRAELPAGDRKFLLGRLDGPREAYAHLEIGLPRGRSTVMRISAAFCGACGTAPRCSLIWMGSRWGRVSGIWC